METTLVATHAKPEEVKPKTLGSDAEELCLYDSNDDTRNTTVTLHKTDPETNKDNAPSQYCMVIPGAGKDKRVYFTLRTPQDEEEIISYPFTEETMHMFVDEYLENSPFFRKVFAKKDILSLVNRYMTHVQYKRGTLSYYRDWLLGTRIRRDDFVEFVTNNSPRLAESLTGPEPEQEIGHGLGLEEDEVKAINDLRTELGPEKFFELLLDEFVMRRQTVAKAEAGIAQQDTIVQEENVTFSDQRETVRDTGMLNNQVLEPGDLSMGEQQWNVKELLNKPMPCYSLKWSTGDDQGKELLTMAVPGDFIKGIHEKIISSFTLFRAHPQVRIQLNGTKFHAGRIMVVFIPRFNKDAKEQNFYDYNSLTACPHVMLDASFSNSGVLELPFTHEEMYFNVQTRRKWQTLGVLKVIVFNKLLAAEAASSSLSLTIWMSYKDADMHLPKYTGTQVLPTFATMQGPAVAEAEALLTSVASNALSDLMPKLGNVGGGAKNQDKPTDVVEIARWVPNAVTSMCYGKGLDRSNRLGLDPAGFTEPYSGIVSTTTDDMNLLELCKIPCRLAAFSWQESRQDLTSIGTVSVAPTYVAYGDAALNPELYKPHMLAYCSRPFKFWRGTLKYKVQVIATQMHSGRLAIIYTPPGVTSEDWTIISTYPMIVMDLQEKNEVEFDVSYIAERPWMRCDQIFNVPDANENRKMTGQLHFFVLNKLVKPDGVATTIDVNIFVSAGDDFKLSVPGDIYCVDHIGLPVETKALAEAQQTTVEQTRKETSTAVCINKGPGMIPPADNATMGEDCMDLKTLLRRYNLVYKTYADNPGAMILRFPNTPMLSGVCKFFEDAKDGIQTRTFLAHYSQLYTFWRGSLRYKFVFGHNFLSNSIIKVFHIPGISELPFFKQTTSTREFRSFLDHATSYGTQVAVENVQGSLEFEIPFYTNMSQLTTGAYNAKGQHSSLSCTGSIYVTIQAEKISAGTNERLGYELYQAAGDDFQLNYVKYPVILGLKNETLKYNGVLVTNLYIPYPLPSIAQEAAAPATTEPRPTLRTAEALVDYIPGVPTVKNTISRMNNTSAKVDSVCDTATHLLQQASKKLGLTTSKDDDDSEPTTTIFEDASLMCAPMLPLIENALQYIKLLPDTISSYFKPNLTATDVLVEVSTLVSGFTAFTSATNLIQKICAIVTIAATLLKEISTQLKNSLYHLVTQIFETINGNKQGNQLPLAEASGFDLVAPLTATIAVAVGAIGFKKLPNDKETIDLCKGISEKLRLFNFSSTAMTNVKNLWNEVKDLMQWCMDYVMNLISPQLLAQLRLEREFEDIQNWTAFVDELDNIQYADKIHYDYVFRNKVYRAIDAGKKYNALLIDGKCGRAASVIREYVRKITEIGANCEKSKNQLPFRKDPFCIFMYGATDIGKSGCITNVGFDIMDALDYPRHNRWCAINCTEKYFTENYRQQAAVYFDDFSTFTTEEQYQKFFNLKANTAYPLDMAFRKGEYFNSDFIFGTTNTPYPEPNFVTNHDALLRRRDLLIEADWIDTPEIQEALRLKQPMARFRQLDNSHLRFRFANPRDPEMCPGAWLGYDEMVAECVADAREHLQRQQAKLTSDLTRAGYIVPTAEAGELRKICLEAAKNSPSLRLYDQEIWPHLTWNLERQEFEPGPDADDYILEEWTNMNFFFQGMGIDLQKILKDNSYIVKEESTLAKKIKYGLLEFKLFLGNCVKKIQEDYPWIAIMGKWSLYIAGALATMGLLWYGVKKVTHACACKILNHYGFRCGFCGKWPAFQNINLNFQQFMLDQWSSLYGNTPYIDGHITTLQEEAALLSVRQATKIQLDKPELGTQRHAEAVYSDVTKGSKIAKVTAQSGPYSTVDKGLKVTRPLANGSELDKDTITDVTRRTAESEQTEKIIYSRIMPYLYRLRTPGKVGLPSMSICSYAIGDRWLMIPSHFFVGLNDGDLFEVFHNGAWMQVEFQREVAVIIPGKDLFIYRMPVQFHAHKSNVHHFISEKELQYFRTGQATLCKLSSQMKNIQVDNLRAQPIEKIDYNLDFGGKLTGYTVQNAWKYQKCSTFGDCGAVLVAHSTKLSGCIIGLHICSDELFSYSQLVTREMLEKLVTKYDGTPIPQAEAKLGNLIPPGHLGRIGKVKPGMEVFQSPKTEIIPTAIHGIISKPVTEPAVLSPNDDRLDKRVNPLRLGIEKYSLCAPPFPLRHRKIVNAMMNDEVRLFKRKRDPKPLTMEETVNGIPELDGYERLPMNTSPGYPWIKTRPGNELGKAYLFDDDGLPVPELRKIFDIREQKAKQCERVESVWVDCLKDERRPLEKIKK